VSRLPHHVSFYVQFADGEKSVAKPSAELIGIAISAGSACHMELTPSPVPAMGYESAAKGTIRLTLADTPQ